MKKGSFIEKIPGGKLLKATASFEGDVISAVSVRGDFFAHPEDAIERLEDALSGKPLPEVRSVVDSSLDGVELYGISREDIVRALEACHAQTQVH